jgi:hypothetical protein
MPVSPCSFPPLFVEKLLYVTNSLVQNSALARPETVILAAGRPVQECVRTVPYGTLPTLAYRME